MKINCDGNGTPLNINTDGLQQEEVNEFYTVSSVTARNGRCEKEVKRRIGKTFLTREENLCPGISI